jgi:protocatechuate 3,4-dioxygenase beta subunit
VVTIADRDGTTRLDLTLAATGRIALRVVDPDGGPVADAQLTFRDARGEMLPYAPNRTDARGEAFAPGLGAGVHDIVVQPRAWATTRTRVVVPEGGLAEATVHVAPGLVLEGAAVDAAGAPVAGLDVTFEAPGDDTTPPQYIRTVTDRRGRFRFTGLLHVPGTLELDDWGERWSFVQRKAQPGGSALTIVVRRAASVRGRFTPVPERRWFTWVTMRDPDDDRAYVAPDDCRTDADGSFALHGLPEGDSMTLRFDVANGRVADLQIAPLLPGEQRDVGTLVVMAARPLRGRAVDRDGVPFARVRVTLAYEEDERTRTVLTDAQGRFRFDSVDPDATPSLTVWTHAHSGRSFDLADWTAKPEHTLVVDP